MPSFQDSFILGVLQPSTSYWAKIERPYRTLKRLNPLYWYFR